MTNASSMFSILLMSGSYAAISFKASVSPTVPMYINILSSPVILSGDFPLPSFLIFGSSRKCISTPLQ